MTRPGPTCVGGCVRSFVFHFLLTHSYAAGFALKLKSRECRDIDNYDQISMDIYG